QMNSVVTSELLCSIFVPGTPLHDGAVIIQGVKIACAAAYFPPTTKDFPSSYGARHRAAVGISEITDSVTIVVSEETGNISIAEAGNLTVVSEKALREYLLMIICQTQNEVLSKKISKQSDLELIENVEKEEPIKSKTSIFANYFKGKNKKVDKEDGEKSKRFVRKKKEVEETPVEVKEEAKEEIKIEVKEKKPRILKSKKKEAEVKIEEEPIPQIMNQVGEDIDSLFTAILDDNKIDVLLDEEVKDDFIFKPEKKKRVKKSETEEKLVKKAKAKVKVEAKVEEEEEKEKVHVSYTKSKKKKDTLNDDREGRDS
ncbi:MAG: DNA integrity scanning protein DisA nucleotide-binding domain protein, partial [Erysipelotrichaceae bacterium]